MSHAHDLLITSFLISSSRLKFTIFLYLSIILSPLHLYKINMYCTLNWNHFCTVTWKNNHSEFLTCNDIFNKLGSLAHLQCPFWCFHPWIKYQELRLDSWWLLLKSQSSVTERIIKPEMLLSKFSVIGTSLFLKLVRCNYQQPLCNCQLTNLHLEETTWNDHSSITVSQAQWIYS